MYSQSHLAVEILLVLFSQLIVADLLQNGLRLCTLISVMLYSQPRLADDIQFALRLNSLLSANLFSQFHLAHAPQIGLRPMIASSDSHIAIPQLADSS